MQIIRYVNLDNFEGDGLPSKEFFIENGESYTIPDFIDALNSGNIATDNHVFMLDRKDYNMENINKTVGDNIRAKRIVLGISQQSLGDVLKISFQQIQKYEKGERTLSIIKLLELATVLRCPIDELLGEYVATPESYASDREGLELVKAFNAIKSKDMRKAISDFVHSLREGADNENKT